MSDREADSLSSDGDFDVVSYEYSDDLQEEEEEEYVSDEEGGFEEVAEPSTAEQAVEVELPSELLEARLDTSLVAVSKPAASSDHSEISSLASSFVPVGPMESLGLGANNHILDDNQSMTSAWSRLDDPTTHTVSSYSMWSDARTMATSVVSGFDFLDIDGYSMRRCHRCSYLNETDAGVCEGCHAALVANPNVDMDAQIAINLQKREEEEALRELERRESEMRMVNEQPLFLRAQNLSKEIHQYVQHILGVSSSRQVTWRGYHLVPVNRLEQLAADFIELAARSVSQGPAVGIAITFTSKHPTTISKIQKDGFGEKTAVLCDPNEAYLYWKQRERPLINTEALPSVVEEEDEEVDNQGAQPPRDPHERECIGWIVATTGRSIRSTPIKEKELNPKELNLSKNSPLRKVVEASMNSEDGKKGTKVKECFDLYTIHGETACLPLLYFDACHRNNETTMRLYRGLKEITFDYFLSRPVEPFTGPLAREPVTATVDESISGENREVSTTETSDEDSKPVATTLPHATSTTGTCDKDSKPAVTTLPDAKATAANLTESPIRHENQTENDLYATLLQVASEQMDQATLDEFTGLSTSSVATTDMTGMLDDQTEMPPLINLSKS